jgi:hypothetical protein
MYERRAKIIESILSERERQFNSHGSELDLKNTPNDWIAIATSCLSEDVRRFDRIPTSDDFEHNLIKCAAVIIAALEHVDVMKLNKFLDLK